MRTFSDAQSDCQSMEANLASIHDQEEHDFIRGNDDRVFKGVLILFKSSFFGPK